MVLHVLADAAQFVHDGHADLSEMLGIANPRQLQYVRRADRTRHEEHLARRIGALDAAAACEFDAGRALAVEHDAVRLDRNYRFGLLAGVAGDWLLHWQQLAVFDCS